MAEQLQARSIAQRLAGIRSERDRRHREVDEDALRQIDEMLDSIINEPELPLRRDEPVLDVTQPQPDAPDADGWIAWDAKPGAVCPVPPGDRVQYELGGEYTATLLASSLIWDDSPPSGCRIVRYRVLA